LFDLFHVGRFEGEYGPFDRQRQTGMLPSPRGAADDPENESPCAGEVAGASKNDRLGRAIEKGLSPLAASAQQQNNSARENNFCSSCGRRFQSSDRKRGSPRKYCSSECRLKAFRTDHAQSVADEQSVAAETQSVAAETQSVAAETAKRHARDDGELEPEVALFDQKTTKFAFDDCGYLVIEQLCYPDEDQRISIAPSNVWEFLDRLTDFCCGVPSFPPKD
jgi:hypothetical protein